MTISLNRLLVSMLACAAAFITPAPAQDLAATALEGRIVRALFVDAGDPDRVLVGEKTDTAGSALIHESVDGGRTWRALNGGRALSAGVSDVQAVIRIDATTVFAGTWTQGAFVSHDGGNTFEPVAGLPSDIRAFATVPGRDADTLCAATGADGVLCSGDGGRTWQNSGPGETFVWSLHATGDGRLHALSPQDGVFERGRDSIWRRLSEEPVYALDETPQGLRALAGEQGLFLSQGGSHWRQVEAIAGERLADALFLPGPRPLLLLASWQNGIIVYDRDGGTTRRVLEGESVVHLARAGDAVLAGTWGHGLKVMPLSALAGSGSP